MGSTVSILLQLPFSVAAWITSNNQGRRAIGPLNYNAYLLTYLLIPWSRVLLEKLTGFAASQEIPRIFGTRRFITVLTVPATCPYPEPTLSSPHNPRPYLPLYNVPRRVNARTCSRVTLKDASAECLSCLRRSGKTPLKFCVLRNRIPCHIPGSKHCKLQCLLTGMWQGTRFRRTQNFNEVLPERLRQLRHSAEASSFNVTLEHVLAFTRLGTLYNSR